MATIAAPSHLARWWDADLAYGFRRSPVALVSALVLAVCLAAALFAPWIAPHNPFDLATLNLTDALTPPRGSTMVEKNKEYIQAARVIGVTPAAIVFRHLLPNVLGPVLVLATINIATAIVLEATLSFLGVGVPPTRPSLGTLIRVGNDFLFSGEWWITIFPGAALVILVLAINLLGDWLRDALNPKLK